MFSEKLNNYLIDHSHPLSDKLQLLTQNTKKNFGSSQMLSGPLISTLLRLLIRIANPKLVVDLGTYTGFSALSMIEVLDKKASLWTCEVDPEHIEEAKKNFKKYANERCIHFFEGCAFDCLNSIHEPIDLAFLDANKTTYLEYYHLLVTKLRPGGLLIMDDVLWKGGAVSPVKEREKRMDQINKIVVQDSRVENLLLPLRNGINIIYKL